MIRLSWIIVDSNVRVLLNLIPRGLAVFGKTMHSKTCIKILSATVLIGLLASCAREPEITTFELVQIKREAETAEISAKEARHYVDEIISQRRDIRGLIRALDETAASTEGQVGVCEVKIKKLGVKLPPPPENKPPDPKLPLK